MADVNGFSILIALVRPVGADFSDGERIAYFYSVDGVQLQSASTPSTELTQQPTQPLLATTLLVS